MKQFGLSQNERIRSRKCITELMASDRRGFVYPLRYIVMTDDSEELPSILFAVPKRGHKRAVERNLLRRRMRESYRLNKSLLDKKGVKIALLYTSKNVHEFILIQNAVQKILKEVRADL